MDVRTIRLFRMGLLCGIGLLCSAGLLSSAGAAPRLGLPVDCDMRRVCAIQQYVDLDPGPERRDYRCGPIASDGHRGTDIRLRRFADLAASAPVVAAAAGRVLRVRDGMADANVRQTGAAAIGDRLAGNGLVIDHGDGWETQYSHLKRGSIAVRPGQVVAAGEALGAIGMSGNAEFPHLHFEVRRGGTTIDPFSGRAAGGGCQGARRSMWDAGAAAALAYRTPEILTIGLAQSAAAASVARTATVVAALAADPPALVVWADVVGARDGDMQTFRLATDGGTEVFDRRSRVVKGGLSWFAFAGLQRPANGWPPGRYTLSYMIERPGEKPVSQQAVVTLK